MNVIKPLGSLTSGLLARKGFARPAMRSPLHQYPLEDEQPFAGEPDDLGWNDMGEDAAPQLPELQLPDFQLSEADTLPQADVVAISDQVETPQPGLLVAKPDVVLRQEAMARLICVAPGSRRPRGTALVEGRRAAFTLRVDAGRHNALRLACRLRNSSAQILLIEALDKFLADIPEVAGLAEQRNPQTR